jgi:hypothetical protein
MLSRGKKLSEVLDKPTPKTWEEARQQKIKEMKEWQEKSERPTAS